jgi:hypothetical protein
MGSMVCSLYLACFHYVKAPAENFRVQQGAGVPIFLNAFHVAGFTEWSCGFGRMCQAGAYFGNSLL